MASYGGNGDGFENAEVIEFGRRFGEPVRKNLLRILIVVLILIAGYSAFYQIEPEQVGLVTRFGAYIRTVEPGLHFKWPFGIDRVWKVPVQRQLKQEFGFKTKEPGVRTRYEVTPESAREARMLTGDLNVANVEWIIQYKVKDPKKFAFSVRNLDKTQQEVFGVFGLVTTTEASTLRDMTEAAMRQVVGDHSVTEVLTIGRESIQIRAKEALQDLCNRYKTGIEIRQLVLQNVNPPEPVQASFNEVNQAIQEKERMVNQAWARYNSIIPEARGRAAQVLQAAEGYATERVNMARGDVQRFVALQSEYAKAPVVTRTRLYLETMAEVLPEAKRRIIVDDQIKGLLPLLPLDGPRPGGK